MKNVGKFIGEIEKIPGLNQLYKVCDYAFNVAMELAGKIHPNFESFLREHQGFFGFGFGFGFSYGFVRLFEKGVRKCGDRLFDINSLDLDYELYESLHNKYNKILPCLEKIGYGINIVIPVAIETFNPGGLQGLFENNPVFSCGLIGLELGSTLAALQEGHNRKIKSLEDKI